MMTANKWVYSEDPRIPCTTPLEATSATPGMEKEKKQPTLTVVHRHCSSENKLWCNKLLCAAKRESHGSIAL